MIRLHARAHVCVCVCHRVEKYNDSFIGGIHASASPSFPLTTHQFLKRVTVFLLTVSHKLGRDVNSVEQFSVIISEPQSMTLGMFVSAFVWTGFFLRTWIVSSELAAGWGFEREEMKKEGFFFFF